MNLEKEMRKVTEREYNTYTGEYDFDTGAIGVENAIKIAKQYAREMCKKQKDICADELNEYVSYADNWNNIIHAPLITELK